MRTIRSRAKPSPSKEGAIDAIIGIKISGDEIITVTIRMRSAKGVEFSADGDICCDSGYVCHSRYGCVRIAWTTKGSCTNACSYPLSFSVFPLITEKTTAAILTPVRIKKI